jgi:type I restriction enzyme M protein
MKKSLGNKRNEIGSGEAGQPNHIEEITRLYGNFRETEKNRIFRNQDFGYLKITVERPLRLNFAVTDERIGLFKAGSYFTGLVQSKKRKAGAAKAKEIAEGEEQQAQILAVLEKLKDAVRKTVNDRAVFEEILEKAFKKSPIKLDALLKKALLVPDSLGKRDPAAEICYDSKGRPEPDPELRDTENVSLPEGIDLPLPLDYETEENKGKIDRDALLDLVREHCEEYLKREVLPYRPDAWIDHDKIKVGYEIPFTRHFYKYEPPRPLPAIEADIQGLEKEIVRMLAEVTA